MTTKNLYQLTFNWHGEIHVIWTHAASEELAFSLAAIRLAKLLDIPRSRVSFYFSGSDKYFIRKEVKQNANEISKAS